MLNWRESRESQESTRVILVLDLAPRWGLTRPSQYESHTVCSPASCWKDPQKIKSIKLYTSHDWLSSDELTLPREQQISCKLLLLASMIIDDINKQTQHRLGLTLLWWNHKMWILQIISSFQFKFPTHCADHFLHILVREPSWTICIIFLIFVFKYCQCMYME